MKRLLRGITLTKFIFFALMLITIGCGEGETCDCCKSKKDCKFGLQCVELIGGVGKVCGSTGINYCSADACLSSSQSKLEAENVSVFAINRPDETSSIESYAFVESLKSFVEDEDVDSEKD